MKKTISLALCTAMLAGCSLTAPQQTAVTSAGVTLATVAAQNNMTVASLVTKGALFCGNTTSPEGVLVGAGIVAIASAAKVPVSVIGQTKSDVASACSALGLVAGALPAGTDPTTVAVKTVSTALPAV